jgi:hypothetical protein
MRLSSRFGVSQLVASAVAEHRVEHVDAAAGEGDDGLVVDLAFGAFAGVEGFAGGMLQRAERGLDEDALERLVAAGGALEVAHLARLLSTGARPAAAASWSGVAKRLTLPAAAMNSAVSVTPIPGRLRMRAASGCWSRAASSSASSAARRRLVAAISDELADDVGRDGLAGHGEGLGPGGGQGGVGERLDARGRQASGAGMWSMSRRRPARRISAGVT